VPGAALCQRFEILQPVELSRANFRAAGARTTTSTIVGVSRTTRSTLARSSR
jgi:hypothetical protein